MNKDEFFPPMGNRCYINPLPVSDCCDESVPKAQPDPYVMRFNGEYYAYSTGKTVPVFHSRDMINWEYCGVALDAPEQTDYWAPAVYYEGGKFYMYYSSWQPSLPTQALKVAVADSPLGPFEYQKTFFNVFSIDAHAAKDNKGDLYLYYMLDDYNGPEVEYAGTAIMCDRLIDPLTLEGNPRVILSPSMTEETFQKNRSGDGRDWHTIEGPFYFEHGKKRYLFYSGAAFWFETYFTNYASLSLNQDIREGEWLKYPDAHTYRPLLRRNNHVEGTGHNSMAMAPNMADPWIIYHARDVKEEHPREGDERTMRIDPIFWQGEEMWVPGPSWMWQDAPGMPALQDLFEEKGGLGAIWGSTLGRWTVDDSLVRACPEHILAAAVTKEEFDRAIIETSVRFETLAGGRAGIAVQWKNAENAVFVLMDKVRQVVSVVERKDGVEYIAASVRAAFRPDTWNPLRVEKRSSEVVVYLNECPILTAEVKLEKAPVGLLSIVGKAAFSHFAASRAYTAQMNERLEMQAGFEADYGDYRDSLIRMDKDGAHPSRNSDGCRLWFKGELPESTVLNMHAQILRGDGETLGFVLRDETGREFSCHYHPVSGKMTVNCGGESVECEGGAGEKEMTFIIQRRGGMVRVIANRQIVFEREYAPRFVKAGFSAAKCECVWDYFSCVEWL